MALSLQQCRVRVFCRTFDPSPYTRADYMAAHFERVIVCGKEVQLWDVACEVGAVIRRAGSEAPDVLRASCSPHRHVFFDARGHQVPVELAANTRVELLQTRSRQLDAGASWGSPLAKVEVETKHLYLLFWPVETAFDGVHSSGGMVLCVLSLMALWQSSRGPLPRALGVVQGWLREPWDCDSCWAFKHRARATKGNPVGLLEPARLFGLVSQMEASIRLLPTIPRRQIVTRGWHVEQRSFHCDDIRRVLAAGHPATRIPSSLPDVCSLLEAAAHAAGLVDCWTGAGERPQAARFVLEWFREGHGGVTQWYVPLSVLMNVWVEPYMLPGGRRQIARAVFCPDLGLWLAVLGSYVDDRRMQALAWSLCAAFGAPVVPPHVPPHGWGTHEWNPAGLSGAGLPGQPSLYGLGPLGQLEPRTIPAFPDWRWH